MHDVGEPDSPGRANSGSMVRNWLEAVRRRVGLRYALMLDSSLREYASEFGIAPSRWL